MWGMGWGGVGWGGVSMAGFEKVCSIRDHSKGWNQQKGESCVVGLDLQLDVAPQL